MTIVVAFTVEQWNALRTCATGELESLTEHDEASGIADHLRDAVAAMERGRTDARLRRKPPRKTGRSRPYRLMFSEGGLFTADLYGTYATSDAAWKKQEHYEAERRKRNHAHGFSGWWIVEGPGGYSEAKGVGSQEGKPRPKLVQVKGDDEVCTKCGEAPPTPGYLMCAACAAEGGNQ